MIELTKQQLESFLDNHFVGSSKLDDIVISKQRITTTVGVRNRIAYNGDLSGALYDVLAIKYSDLYFRDTISPTSVYTLSNGALQEEDGYVVLAFDEAQPQQTADYYVFYALLTDEEDGIKNIFNLTNLVSIDFVGCNIKTIGLNGNFTNLEEVNLSNSLDTLNNAFSGMYYGTGNVNINFGNFTNIELGAGAFSGSPIKKMVFPKSSAQYRIPDNCFQGCTNLLEVIIPDSVNEIGKNAFKGCTNLKYVSIGANVAQIKEGAFEGCKSVERYDISYSNNYFLGEDGAILRKKSDKTYSIVFANTYWFDTTLNFRGAGNCHCVHIQDCPQSIVNQNSAPNFSMIMDAAEVPGATGPIEYRKDIYGNNVVGKRVTQFNINVIRSYYDRVVDYFAIPVTYLITEIEEGACAGNDFTDVCLHGVTTGDNVTTFWPYMWIPYYSLETIAKNAFKGALISNSLILPGDPSEGGSFYGESCKQTLTIGESAFENCHLSSLHLYKHTIFGKKAFFGSSMYALNFGNFPPHTNITFNNDGTYNAVDCSIGELAFGNNNLFSITCNITPEYATSGMSTYITNTTVAFNAIISNSTRSILVGCQNTNFTELCGGSATYLRVAANAFYGCSQLTSIWATDGSYPYIRLNYIGDSAFYGCSGISCPDEENALRILGVTAIYNKAFFGCTGIKALVFNCNSSDFNGFFTTAKQELYTKCFGNSGVKTIKITTNNKLEFKAYDAFDGCKLETVNITAANTNADHNFLKYIKTSNVNIENSLIENPYEDSPDTGNMILIQSGNGKDIVNALSYDGTNYNIVEIKSKAFAGVQMNTGNNTNIHIPASVMTLGKNIVAGSTVTNNNTTLTLDGNTVGYTENLVHNDGLSVGLLYYLGGKYFRKIVEDTVTNMGQGYHYYYVQPSTSWFGTDCLEIHEYSDNEDIVLGHILYDSHKNIWARFEYTVDYNYAKDDGVSHAIQLDNTVEFILMYYGQMFEAAETTVNCDATLNGGNTWLQGTDLEVTIPNDISRSGQKTYTYDHYNNTGECFSDCTWATQVTSGKNLGGMNSAFKGCTSLVSLKAAHSHPQNQYGVKDDVNILDGSVPQSMFEGCSNFTGIVPATNGSHPRIPIVYNGSAFKNCVSFNDTDMLMHGTKFYGESFANTGFTEINLVSATYIDPQAFKDCANLASAKADSTCGYYRTFDDGNSIIDNDGIIVLGSINSNFDSYVNFKGIGDYAFYGRNIPSNITWNVNLDDGSGHDNDNFTVGESAFSKCTFGEYQEGGTNDGRMTSKVYGDNAFKDCTNMTYLQILNIVTLGTGLCEGCTSLVNVSLDVNTDIPSKAFAGCTSLVNFITAGNIGANAFAGCTSLDNIDIAYTGETSNKTIDPSAFIGCPLTELNSASGQSGAPIKTLNGYLIAADYVCKLNNDNHYELVVGTRNYQFPDNENVRVIGKHAFNGRGLTGIIVIPGSVTKIDDYAFANNPNITGVFVPSTVEYIGDHAFDGCTNIDYFTLPDSCTYFGNGALNGCSLSKGFNCNTLDERYYIANYAVSQEIDTTNIDPNFNSSIDLSKSTIFTDIADGGFRGVKVKTVKLPSVCTNVGVNAFRACNHLTELHFYSPSCILAQNAFYGCSYLSDVYIHALDGDNMWAGYNTEDGQFYGAGASVSPETRHLHVKANINTTNFQNSAFYHTMVEGNAFTVVYDL